MSDSLNYYLQAAEKLNSWNISETEEIISLLNKVIEEDPSFYRAYIALCNCYTWMGALHQISQSEAAEKVNEILAFLKEKNHNLPEYYLLLAKRNFWVEWNRSTALRNCNRALELHEACADALILKGVIAASEGKGDRALLLLLQAERLAPLSSNLNYFIALIHMYRRDFEEALLCIERNTAVSSSWQQQYCEKVIIHCSLEQFAQAEELIEQLKERFSSRFTDLLNAVLAVYENRREEAFKLLSRIESALHDEADGVQSWYSYLAELYLLLNEKDRALDFLELAVEYRSAPLVFLQLNYLWDDCRDELRFRSITAGMFQSVRKNSERYKRCELSSEEINQLREELTVLMEQEKPWLNPQLTRQQLAVSLGITSHEISQLLNSGIGSGFHDYCNSYRLNRFLELSADPAYGSYTLLSKAFEAGFGSKSTFNSYFRKTTGTTPLRYCRRKCQPTAPHFFLPE